MKETYNFEIFLVTSLYFVHRRKKVTFLQSNKNSRLCPNTANCQENINVLTKYTETRNHILICQLKRIQMEKNPGNPLNFRPDTQSKTLEQTDTTNSGTSKETFIFRNKSNLLLVFYILNIALRRLHTSKCSIHPKESYWVEGSASCFFKSTHGNATQKPY